MWYILDDNGYIDSVSFMPFYCKDKDGVEYKGTIPTGYETLEDWAVNANIRAYKIVSGNLTYDAARDEELQEKWQRQLYTNALTQKSEDGKKIYIINENEEAEEILNVERTNNLQDYSTDEQIIGTWIDGKPIYRRIVSVSVADSGKQTSLVDDAFSSIELIIEAKLYRISSSASVNNAYLSVEINKLKSYSNQIIIYPTKTSFSNCTHLLLEYTKSTD